MATRSDRAPLSARSPNSAAALAGRFLDAGELGIAARTRAFTVLEPAAPPIAFAAGVPVSPAQPPQGIGVPPPGIRVPLPPGISYSPPQPMAVVNPDWKKAQSLRAAILNSNIDEGRKKELLSPWQWLEMRQKELMAKSVSIDASWAAIRERVEGGITRYAEEYWRLNDKLDELNRDYGKYQSYCSRQVSPEESAAAQRECQDIFNGIKTREADINELNAKNVAGYNSAVVPLLSAHNALILDYNPAGEHWDNALQAFMQAANQALASNQAENAFIDYLQKKYGLDKCQRAFLHREISKKQMTKEEIEALAAELADTGDYRCPPRQRE